MSRNPDSSQGSMGLDPRDCGSASHPAGKCSRVSMAHAWLEGCAISLGHWDTCHKTCPFSCSTVQGGNVHPESTPVMSSWLRLWPRGMRNPNQVLQKREDWGVSPWVPGLKGVATSHTRSSGRKVGEIVVQPWRKAAPYEDRSRWNLLESVARSHKYNFIMLSTLPYVSIIIINFILCQV